jgi:hypothetical protein
MPLDGKIIFSPGTVGVNAGPADVTLTLSTPQLSLNQQLEQHPGSTGGALLALLLLPFGLRRKLRHKAGMYRLTMGAFVAFLGLGTMASITGCGSGIPAGDFPIAVTANAGGVVHTIQGGRAYQPHQPMTIGWCTKSCCRTQTDGPALKHFGLLSFSDIFFADHLRSRMLDGLCECQRSAASLSSTEFLQLMTSQRLL